MNIGAVNESVNIGDIIVTFISFGFLTLIVLSIIWFIRANKRRKNQLNHIQDQIDALSKKVNKHFD